MHNLAVERNDGLGWGFGLFFLIHAAAPGVAATVCAIQFGGAYVVPLVALSTVAYLPIVFVIRSATKKKRNIERLNAILSNGRRAWGDIVQVKPGLGSSRSGGQRYRPAAVFLKVEVPGFAPHDVETNHWYRAGDIQRLQVGSRVPVVVAPDNPNDVVIFEVPSAPVWVQQAPVAQGGYRQPFQEHAPYVPPAATGALSKAARRTMIAVIGGSLLMTAALFVAIVVMFSTTDPEAEVVQTFLRRCQSEDYEGAFELLAEDLQKELGTPAALAEHWERADLEVRDFSFGCARGGNGSWRIGQTATVSWSGKARGFQLGNLPYSKCSRAVTADLEEQGGKPRIVAIKIID